MSTDRAPAYPNARARRREARALRGPKGPSGKQTRYLKALREHAGEPSGPMPATADAASNELRRLRALLATRTGKVQTLEAGPPRRASQSAGEAHAGRLERMRGATG